MWLRVAPVRTDVSEECIAIIRVKRISELGTKVAVTSNRITLRRYMMEAIVSSETSVLKRSLGITTQEKAFN
jgi:hypothetical protein